MGDENERSVASSGSVANDPLSVCCRHLAHSQHIIEGKNAEIASMRLTDAEREAVEAAVTYIETPTVPTFIYRHAVTLRGLLERMK